MKKSLVLTSILFSSMALGSVVITPGTVQAVENVEEQQNEDQEVSNKIIYKTSKQEVIDKRNIYGKLGSKISSEDLDIPAGYKLVSNTDNIMFTKNGEHIIIVEAQEIENTIVFYDSKHDEVVSECVFKGFTGETYNISYLIPKGYKNMDYNDNLTIRASDLKQTIDVFKIQKNRNIIHYIDGNGKIVGRNYVYGDEGDTYLIDNDGIPFGYGLEQKQSKKIVFGKDEAVISVKVKEVKDNSNELTNPKKKVVNSFSFYDPFIGDDKILSKYTASGFVGDKVETMIPDNIIPKGYVIDYYPYDDLLFSDDMYYIDRRIRILKLVTVRISFIDYSGRTLVTKTVIGKEGSNISVLAPKGYKMINNTDTIHLNSKISQTSILVVPSKQGVTPDITNLTTNVIFTDKDMKKQISKTQVSGKEGTSQKVTIPAGYKLANGSSNIVKMEKNTGSVTIQLVKVNGSIAVTKPGSNNNHSGSHSSTSGRVESYSTSISTHLSGSTPLFNIQGKEVRNRALMANSNWHVDKKMTLNGKVYYRVATSEWVSADNVYEYTSNKTVINTAKGSYKRLYNSKGKLNTNRALASNTSWATDKTAMINGVKMYRVATDEWVAASDIQ